MRLLAPLLLVTGLVAQGNIEPVPPHILVETVGPDGWRSRLGPTNVGVMLSSKEARDIWQPQLAPMLGFWQMMVGDEEAFAAASQRIFAYGGNVRMAVRNGEAGPAYVAVMLTDDGRTDLAAMATDLRQIIGRGLPGEWLDIELAGTQRTLRINGTDAITAPFLAGGHLFLVAGDLDTMSQGMGLAAHLRNRPLAIDKPTPTSPALQITFDLPALMKASGMRADDDWQIAKALGFDDLDSAVLSLHAAGPRIALDISVSLKAEPRGMVAAFMPNSQGVSGLAALLPEATSAWKIGRFNCEALFDGIVGAIQASGWASAPDNLRDDINEEVGIDVAKDLLANMTDELLVVGSPFQDFDRADEATWMVAFRLRDDAKFRTSLLTMLKHTKPFLSVGETVDVDGIELRRYGNMVGYDLWITVGNGVFVLSAGRDAEELATDLLRKAKATQLDSTGLLSTWGTGLKRYLPPGHNGIAQLDLKSAIGIPSEWWFGIFNEFVPMPRGAAIDPEEMEERQEQMLKLLASHNLTLVRTATGFADARFHWRLFW